MIEEPVDAFGKDAAGLRASSPGRLRRLFSGWSASLFQMFLGLTQQIALVPVFLHFWTGEILAAWLVIFAFGNLVLIARVLAELRIPHLIVFDSDRGRPGQNENDFIRSHAGKAPVIELDPDFEGVAGIRSHDDKVFHAWQRFSKIDEDRIPSEFREIAETAVRLGSGG